MKKILLLGLLFAFVFASGDLLAQERTVSGKVTSQDDGSPLPGVTVTLSGTTIGTISDMDGNFQLSVPESGGTLSFAFVGYATSQVAIGNRSVFEVALSVDTQILDEVVVTAIGIQREAKGLGYSVERVSGDKVQQVAEPDPLRGLQGKVAGVNIQGSSGAAGSATRITIRGNSSLLGNNQPLFIVDGIPYDNSTNATSNQLTGGGAYGSRFSDIDPNNIESINFLKGGAAAALYGTRAANGVVVITTKSGSAKRTRKGLEISLNSSVAFEDIANLPEYQNTYGTGTNFIYSQVNGSWGAPFPGARPYANTNEIPHWYRGRPGFGGIYDDVMVPYRAEPNNVSSVFQQGVMLDNSITISGGNDRSALNVTVSRMTQDGFVPNSESNRTNINVGGNTYLDNGFTVGANLQYSNNVQNGVLAGVGSLGSNNPSFFARTLYLGRNWDMTQPFQNPVDRGSEFFVGRGQADNPLWSAENAGFNREVDRVLASFNVGKEITDNLSFDYKLGVNTYSQRNKDFIRPGSTGADGIGLVISDYINFTELESNFIITYRTDFSEDLSFRAFVGHNINQRKTDRLAAQGQGYVSFDIDNINNTNDVVPFGGGFSNRRIIGVFGDILLGYRDWAFLNLTARNDWSSTLPEENRSFFYPAISTSLVLSEALDIQSPTLSMFKLRGAYSFVGADTGPYQLVPVFINNPGAAFPFSPSGAGTFAGSSLSTVARDPNLLPEQTREIELGMELGLLNNRVSVDFTYYKRNSTNQIAQVALPFETGFASLFTNFGEVSNEGVELTVGATPVRTQGGFTWNVLGTFTHNKNVVVELREGVEEIAFGTGFAGAVATVHRPGQEYGLLRGSLSARDQDGNLLINPANGQLISALDPGIIGNPNPDFLLGLTNTFSYKGIFLSAVFDWTQGGDLYSNTVLSLLGRGVTKDTENREMNYIIPGVYGNPNTVEPIRTEEGNKIPNETMIETNSLWFGNTFAINAQNEWSVYDATVFRLREITLGYTLPKNLLQNTPFGSATVSFTGRNLWFFAPGFPEFTNYDPEVNQFGNTNQQGVEYSITPTAKRYAFNLRLTF